MTKNEAESILRKEGLHVWNRADSLLIAATIEETPIGLRYCHEASVLRMSGDHWVAVLPSRGHLLYEVPGELHELVDLIVEAYRERNRVGCPYWQALEKTVPNLRQYLMDGSRIRNEATASL